MTARAPRRTLGANTALISVGLGFDALTKDGLGLFLTDLQASFSMSYAEGGQLAAARTLSYALLQIPAGYLADRFRPRLVFVTGISAAMLLTLHLATVESYPEALVNQVLSGASRALIFAPGLVLLTRWYDGSGRATAMGWYVFGGVGGAVVLGILGPPLAHAGSWRLPFAVFAVAGLLYCAFFLWRSEVPPPPSPRSETGPAPPASGVARLLGSSVVWLASLLHVVRLAVFEGLAFWLPTILLERGLSLGLIGVVLAVRMFLSGVGSVIGGRIADRTGPFAVLTTALVGLTAGLLLLAHASQPWILILLACVTGLLAQAYVAPLFAIPLTAFDTRAAGTLAGISNTIGQFGALIVIVFMGTFRDSTGKFLIPVYLLAGLCLVGLVLEMFLRRRSRPHFPT